jgi:four helix bundle protein
METKNLKFKSQNDNSQLKTDLRNRCYSFSIQIIRFIESIEVKRVYVSILDQLLRSATSIGANITEAKSARSKRDFINFYQIALKSANETKYWLCLIRDGLRINKKVITELLREVEELANMIAASLLTLKNKR